jgi:hypothetical protein
MKDIMNKPLRQINAAAPCYLEQRQDWQWRQCQNFVVFDFLRNNEKFQANIAREYSQAKLG